MRTIFVALCLFLCSQADASTYDIVLSGKKCSERESQQLDCEYRIGKDLWITVAGIGQGDVGVTFMKADFNGDYYATFGLMHSCVVVKPGKKIEALADFAFISPRTGKVFKSWQECKAD